MLEGAFTKGYAPELYSFAEDRKLSTQALGQVSENTRLFLGFHTNGNQGDFRLDFEGASSFPSKLYLRDLLTNTLVDMTKTNSYSFQAGQDDPPQRFVLSFGSTGLSDTEGAEVFLYQNKLYTIPVTGPVRIDVYSLTGQKVLSVLTSQSPVPIQLKRSLYLIRVEMPGKTVCLKAWIY